MATYTSITKAELEQCVAPYGITDVLDFKPIVGGNANSSFLLHTSTDKYVLTILEERDQEQARDLARLLQWLNKYQFSTSQVGITYSGQAISRFKGKPIMLKKWISGRVVEDFESTMLLEVGESLAKLNQLPVPDFVPHSHPFGVETFSMLLDKKLDLAYEKWLGEQMVNISSNLSDELPRGLIHGDLFFDNVLFESDAFKAIIDFEEACHYYLTFDLGMSIVGLCKEDGKINWDKAKSFIEGYEQIRPLETEEKASLQGFTAYAATATSSWRYWKYNFDTPQPERKNKHWEMMNLTNEINAMEQDDFLDRIFV